MQKSRVKRVGALLVGLTLVAAACGSDDDDSSSTEAPAATDEMAEDKTNELDEEEPEGAGCSSDGVLESNSNNT